MPYDNGERRMPELIPVQRTNHQFAAEPVTAAEAEAMFRACLNLFRHWQASDADAAVLLDMAPRTFARRKIAKGRFSRDQMARMSNLMGIHKALRLTFVDTDRVYSWPRLPNEAFGGRSALQVMLSGELTDLMRVRRYLDSTRGGW